MMMSKQAPDSTDETSPSFAVKPSQPPSAASVEDLEKKLAMLGGLSSDAAPANPPDSMSISNVPAPTPVALPPAPVAAAAPPAQGGKSALLARIVAAQERTKQAQTKAEPANTTQDLLMDLDAPNAMETPPPAFDTHLLPPPPTMDAPPPFEASAPPPTMMMAPMSAPPPPFEAVAPPPLDAPSAPMFEPSAPSFDLLGEHSHPPPPPLEEFQAMPPPPMEPQIDEDVLAALDPAEREALLEEQRQIMEQIEQNKVKNQTSGAAARAMAFDQRSNAAVARAAGAMEMPGAPPAYTSSKKSSSKKKNGSSKNSQRTINLGAGEEVPVHGQERTKQAIKEGTAITVQCMNCQNMMQVTGHATLMFCPVCQVVSPVIEAGGDAQGAAAAGGDDSQMDADARLAQQLQNEEYKMAGGDGSSATASSRPAARAKSTPKPSEGDGQSWFDWMVGKPAATQTSSSRSREAPAASSSRSGGLISAQTGTERSRARSFDESEGLMAGGGGGGARVAQQKGMFACVTDSIATATTAMYTDEEGNVHGVDSSSLLAMPQVSRQRD